MHLRAPAFRGRPSRASLLRRGRDCARCAASRLSLGRRASGARRVEDAAKDALRTKVVVGFELELARGRNLDGGPGREDGEAVGVARAAEALTSRSAGLAVRPRVGARICRGRGRRAAPRGGVQDFVGRRESRAGDEDEQDEKGEGPPAASVMGSRGSGVLRSVHRAAPASRGRS